MSPRERKLLILFGSAGFVVLNFLAFGFYQKKHAEVEQRRQTALTQLESARMFSESSEQVIDEMEWLADREPEPVENQTVQTRLQELCEREAKSVGLTIKSQKPLPSDTAPELHYHRAKLQITVNGSEEALYRWFDRLNVPDEFRITTQIRVSPNTQDDTQIDCTATVEQWFVPPPPAA